MRVGMQLSPHTFFLECGALVEESGIFAQAPLLLRAFLPPSYFQGCKTEKIKIVKSLNQIVKSLNR